MKYALTALLCFTLLHCGGTESGNPSLIDRMDIADATTLYVAPGTGTTSKLSTSFTATSAAPEFAEDTFVKITTEGNIEAVKYFDQGGGEIEMRHTPTNIWDVNDQYLVIFFYDPDETHLLVRKTDGAVFLLSTWDRRHGDQWYPPFGETDNLDLFGTDGGNNIYYISDAVVSQTENTTHSTNAVHKINVTDEDVLTREVVTSLADSVAYFAVAGDGTIVYDSWDISRIQTTNGSLQNAPASYASYWTGLDGQVTFADEYGCDIDKLYVDVDFTPSFRDYADLTDPDCVGEIEPFSIGSPSRLLRMNDRLFYVTTGGIWEIENPAESPRKITLTISFQLFGQAQTSDDHIYFIGRTEEGAKNVIKVDPSEGEESETELLDPNEFEVSQMAVSPDNVVNFSGLRFSDGALVVGEIAADGEVTLISENLGGEITVLIRLR